MVPKSLEVVPSFRSLLPEACSKCDLGTTRPQYTHKRRWNMLDATGRPSMAPQRPESARSMPPAKLRKTLTVIDKAICTEIDGV